MATPAIKYQWDGEALVPSSGFWRRQADAHLVVGEIYRLVEEAETSDKSRAHEFAWLKEAWNSLPDNLLEQFPSPEHLRKYGLIKKGHCTMKQHVCFTEAEADRTRIALDEEADEYALIIRREKVVTVYRAVSQSRRAMGAPMFQKSKSDLMEFVGDLLGVDPATLGKVEVAA